MKLLAYMREHDIGDDPMADAIGDCSGHAVKKWKYGEREPDASTIARIEVVTRGSVTLADWVAQRAERSQRARAREAGAAA